MKMAKMKMDQKTPMPKMSMTKDGMPSVPKAPTQPNLAKIMKQRKLGRAM